MEDFKQKYEGFYYEIARPIIRKHNTNRTKRIKKILMELIIITLGFAIIFVVCLVGFSAFFPVKFVLGMTILALPLLFTIINMVNPSKNHEAELKYKIMDKFLEIFGTFDWHHGNNLPEKILNTDDYVIFPKKFLLSFDDIIYGWYQNKVEVYINECKTERNSFLTILPLLFPIFITTAIISILLLIIIFIFIHEVILTWYNPFSYIFLGLVLMPLIVCFKITWSSINRGNFQGLVIECKLPKNFSGMTFFYEHNPFTNKNVDRNYHKTMQTVKLEDVEFNKDYLIFSDNQIEARYILTSAFINRLNNIKTIFKSKYMRTEFKNNKMLLIIHIGRDMFSFNQYKKLSKTDFDKVFEELNSLFALIDELKLDVKTGL